MGPETAAVLAHAPAFGFPSPLGRGVPQTLAGHARLALLVGVEPREMVTEDLLLGIALDPFRAGVPAAHAAFQVQHVEGVIGHPLHQQPQLVLAFAQLPLRLAPFGQITGDLGETHQLARGIADGVDDHVRPEAAAVLADPPTLPFEATLLERDAQRRGRQIDGAIFIGVELREVLTDDLLGGVALEPLGAGVPAAHHPLGVEHVDGIVADAFDQQPIAAVCGRRLVWIWIRVQLKAPGRREGRQSSAGSVHAPLRWASHDPTQITTPWNIKGSGASPAKGAPTPSGLSARCPKPARRIRPGPSIFRSPASTPHRPPGSANSSRA